MDGWMYVCTYVCRHKGDSQEPCPAAVCPSSLGLHHLQPTNAQARRSKEGSGCGLRASDLGFRGSGLGFRV